jgi:hypothetical protein
MGRAERFKSRTNVEGRIFISEDLRCWMGGGFQKNGLEKDREERFKFIELETSRHIKIESRWRLTRFHSLDLWR